MKKLKTIWSNIKYIWNHIGPKMQGILFGLLWAQSTFLFSDITYYVRNQMEYYFSFPLLLMGNIFIIYLTIGFVLFSSLFMIWWVKD